VNDHSTLATPAPEIAEQLRELERAVGASAAAPLPQTLIDYARDRAESFATATSQPSQGAGVSFVAEVVGATWLEPGWNRHSIDRVVSRTASVTGTDATRTRSSLFVRVIREESLFELPPRIAIEAQLQMLVAFGPADEASLWLAADAGRRVASFLEVGGAPSRRARAAAAAAISTDEVVTGSRAQLQAVPIRGWDGAEAAIVVRGPLERRDLLLSYARECARAVKPLLEIEGLLERHAARERSLLESSERRLVRLGLDLHDGPMQDLAALAQDIRLYRSQLTPFLQDVPEQAILLGRLDDLDARLLAMDSELRELARSLQAPTALKESLLELLSRDVERFAERTSVTVDLSTTGDFEGLTSSQKIALLRVVNEALNNVHEHSGAGEASVRVSAEVASLGVEVVDEGKGFDVDARLIAAAKAGRLGLVGMSERVRLLGGRFDLQSKPGGPTRVRATIPRWQPLRRVDE
jgi:signal transduction histidine kinase